MNRIWRMAALKYGSAVAARSSWARVYSAGRASRVCAASVARAQAGMARQPSYASVVVTKLIPSSRRTISSSTNDARDSSPAARAWRATCATSMGETWPKCRYIDRCDTAAASGRPQSSA